MMEQQNAVRSDAYKTSSNLKIAVPAIAVGLYSLRTIYCYIHRKMKKYPPGPIGIPFFGSLFSCIDIPKYAAYLASNYGSVSMVYIGSQPFVFLHSISLINEVFKNKLALDREMESSLLFTHLKPTELNTAFISQEWWPRKRKMFQAVMISRLDSIFLNNVHNKSLNSHVLQSINECIRENKLYFPYNDLSYMLFHAIWNALFGSYIQYNSKHKQIISNYINSTIQNAAKDIPIRYLGIQNIMPSSFTNPWQDTVKNFQNYIEKLLYQQLNYDEKIFDYNDTKWDKHFQQIVNGDSCIASQFIAAHRNAPSTDSSKLAILEEFVLFFNAGVDTSLNTAEYGMILLAKYKNVQDKIYNELKHEFGGNDWEMNKIEIRKVIQKLHNLRAFIYEVLRISSVVPVGVAHYNSKSEIQLQNSQYIIPKNSIILSDILTANRKDAYWDKKTNGNGMDLCLDAWLDKNGHFKYNLNKDKIVTFGVGPRECAGMSMALRSLYLLFAKLILNYKFTLSEKDKNGQIQQTFKFMMVIQPKIGLKAEKRKI